ncbi:MAG TPA: type II toxin-antitoxin system RelE/ParE family toxin [Paraburkholderia sp.]|jgi:toxin ParE1/3/4|uniref:type II toxin-antitoxin system RelE/ParE family toxin n=1 Tax=Paraburkholderia sp. TaxID=1926495 RepID=UPI002DF0B6A5|nr:type II toxin-antitoxin system RelE/ParE family toxin [Paraburkholderia sp.]
MITPGGDWHVRLAALAEKDFRHILRWSTEHFGAAQARDYARTLTTTLQDLSFGPEIPGVRHRDEISPGLMTLHVAHNRRRGRHFVMFRVSAEQVRHIDVLRILHDAMDLPAHA